MLTPTLIAAARADINRHFARNLRIAFKRAVRRIRLAFAHLAEARRHRREIEFLLHADDRMLSDIGLTRADVHFAYGGHGKSGLWDAAERRNQASHARVSGIEKLPRADSPSLAPALSGQTVGHGNFR
jgi:uncharacterized protein YjiS (DUF1127 family)